MATKTYTRLLDDLDGSDADETIRFGIDGVTYAIDLNSGHASELRDFLSRFQEAARKERGSTKRQTKSTGGVDTKAVRLWAADNGIQVNTRGRLQADVVEKYLAAH
ncbi:histone-like nucleoid-structuring protein Lsr2 [Arthrobacter sp. 9MFCol3.1]|uniref:histone-like nucleoid-structuring protein Lsr2 n=1 Tax=Arthrobacter sp. 9MFCol3.1 TaxID=1150398 RepID=UPI000478EA7F|nr:Lsr2 family protein [Arthrobacter sp. 9MFCol3.1]